MNYFNGLMAAPFAPLDSKGKLALDIIPQYAQKLEKDGLTGMFVCGSNGEGMNMTSEERMLTAAAFKEAAGPSLKVFVHVGHASISESQKLAEHAMKIGADAVSAVSAFYFKPKSAENLVDCLAEIALAAPVLPFYYYHIPHLTGVHIDMFKFLKLAEKKIPNLGGVKYTATTLHEYQQCLNYSKNKYDFLFGLDEMLLSALAVGARGMVGSTYNFAGPLYLGVMNSFTRGDLMDARKKMLYLVEMVSILLKFPAISAQKAVMKRLGLDLGPCRLPLTTLSRADESSLYTQLDEMHFFEALLSPASNNGENKGHL